MSACWGDPVGNPELPKAAFREGRPPLQAESQLRPRRAAGDGGAGVQPSSGAPDAGLRTVQAFEPSFRVDPRGGGGWEIEELLTPRASKDQSLQLCNPPELLAPKGEDRVLLNGGIGGRGSNFNPAVPTLTDNFFVKSFVFP